MKRITLILIMLSTNIYIGFGQNTQLAQISYETLVTWFNPHMGKAYKHYPVFGSGKVSEYTVKDGKLVSYTHKSETESNGMYFYITTEEYHHIQYSDSTIIVTCDFTQTGDSRCHINSSSHSHTYSFEDISHVGDSTYAVPANNWILTVNENNWSNQTELENNLWNIEIVFENSFPIKIKRGEEVIRFNYLKIDEFGNWTEREVIYENGLTRIQTRSIEYTSEQCN